MFRYLQVPISNLNTKDKRDKPEAVDENFRYLNKVNKKTVAAALDDLLESMLKQSQNPSISGRLLCRQI